MWVTTRNGSWLLARRRLTNLGGNTSSLKILEWIGDCAAVFHTDSDSQTVKRYCMVLNARDYKICSVKWPRREVTYYGQTIEFKLTTSTNESIPTGTRDSWNIWVLHTINNNPQRTNTLSRWFLPHRSTLWYRRPILMLHPTITAKIGHCTWRTTARVTGR